MNIRQAVLNNENVCTQVGTLKELKEGNIAIDGSADVMGKLYNNTDNSWSTVPPTPPPPIRNITKRAFMKRIDQADRILIRKSTDDIVIDIHEDLKIATSVDLDDQDVIDAIAYLSSQSLLLNTDIDNLRADGD